MAWHTLRYDHIDAFKARWPAHGLPDELHSVSAEFDSDGNVVDIEAYTHNDDGSETSLEWREFDGTSFAALIEDCRELGDISNATSQTAPSFPL